MNVSFLLTLISSVHLTSSHWSSGQLSQSESFRLVNRPFCSGDQNLLAYLHHLSLVDMPSAIVHL